MARPPESVRLLLADAIDYAGLFPPASLSMADTAARYAAYRRSADSWALGRLVVPASRLRELVPQLGAAPPEAAWRLCVLLGSDIEVDLAAARDLAPGAPVRVAALEAAAATPEAVAALAQAASPAAAALGAVIYIEVPLAEDPVPLVQAIRRAGLRAKARTGGVTAAAIPDHALVARFLSACAGADVAFKLTAGLHHAVRGPHPLTYEAASPGARMHGFLNVLAATVFLATGAAMDQVTLALDEDDGKAFHFGADRLRWRDLRADLDAVRAARKRLISFGSCSFEEPLDELRALGLA